MTTPGDLKVSYKGPPREQKPDPGAQTSQSTGTGGGGSGGPPAPQPTAEAPKPETGAGIGSHKSADHAGDGGSSGGISSGLQPGGLSPTNEGFAGMGRLDTPGASTGPDAALGKTGS